MKCSEILIVWFTNSRQPPILKNDAGEVLRSNICENNKHFISGKIIFTDDKWCSWYLWTIQHIFKPVLDDIGGNLGISHDYAGEEFSTTLHHHCRDLSIVLFKQNKRLHWVDLLIGIRISVLRKTFANTLLDNYWNKKNLNIFSNDNDNDNDNENIFIAMNLQQTKCARNITNDQLFHR